MSRSIPFTIMRVVGSMLSPGGAHSPLSILIYHRVPAAQDEMMPGEVDAAAFGEQMALLASNFNVLPLDEAVQRLPRGGLPARAACVTFDDGYADNHDVALPILRRLGIPATFFVATGFLDGGRMWNDTIIETIRRIQTPVLELTGLGLDTYPLHSIGERRASAQLVLNIIKHRPPDERRELVEEIAKFSPQPLPNALMMTRSQVRTLHNAGMGVGGHTVTHPILARVSDEHAKQEMAEGKEVLGSVIGAPVRLFAYPNGRPIDDFGPAHVALARKLGFRAAVTTCWGAARPTTDVFQIPRFTPWDRHPLKFIARLLLNARRTAHEI